MPLMCTVNDLKTTLLEGQLPLWPFCRDAAEFFIISFFNKILKEKFFFAK